ncbi:MAG: TorD/DmsD family molecular chaperone [Halobacteriota archaeon]
MATTDQVIDVPDDRTADTVATIARCWRYPNEELVTAIDSGLFEAELPATPTVDALREEYTRLFVGPGDHPCPPYESVYRSGGSEESAPQVLGESTRSVVDWYRRYDLVQDSTWRDLPDHVAVELEFASHLAENDPDALPAFLNEHPQQWLPAFLTAVEDHARMPFYRTLAVTTKYLLHQSD